MEVPARCAMDRFGYRLGLAQSRGLRVKDNCKFKEFGFGVSASVETECEGEGAIETMRAIVRVMWARVWLRVWVIVASD